MRTGGCICNHLAMDKDNNTNNNNTKNGKCTTLVSAHIVPTTQKLPTKQHILSLILFPVPFLQKGGDFAQPSLLLQLLLLPVSCSSLPKKCQKRKFITVGTNFGPQRIISVLVMASLLPSLLLPPYDHAAVAAAQSMEYYNHLNRVILVFSPPQSREIKRNIFL